MAVKNYVAFDLGAESGRTMLGTLDGQKLTLTEKHRFANPTSRFNGHLHWNLLGQWEELKSGLRSCAGERLSGIGVDTWGVDFGLIGAGGEVLGSPYHYRDARTEGMLNKAFDIAGKEAIFNATGIQFMQLNTLYQLLAMKHANSPALKAAQTLLFMPDLFNYLFTGQRKSEFSIATTSQMYDPRKKTWATELLKKLELPTDILPDIIPSGTVIGPLRDDVRKECGVGAIPVIAPGCHDTASAVAAAPVDGQRDDWCYISSGTWSLMGVEIAEPIINEKSLRYNYTNEGGVGGTIRFLKNIMGLWLVQECRRHFAAQGKQHTYVELTQMAAGSKPFTAVIDPEYQPFASPGDMPGKIGQFCRETKQSSAPQSIGEFVRTCLESLALTYRKTIEGLQDILGRRISVIHIVGGGTQNELLNQMTADACGRTVITGPVEATAIGNILVQAMASGQIRDLSEARAVVRNSFDVKRYEPCDARQWEQAYERYRAAQIQS